MRQKELTRSDSIQAALEALKARRPLRAEEICRDYLQSNPGCADHLRLLGHALQKQNRLEEAEKQLRFGLSLKPNFPQLHEELGSVLAMQGRFDDAITSLEQAVQLDPTQALAHKKLAQALAMAGRGEDADRSFEDYFDKRPEDGEVARGANLLKEGRTDEAIEVFLAIIRENPKSVNAMRFLAMAYWHEKERMDDAEALLRRVVEMAPDFTVAWINLGMVLVERNKLLDAIDAYQHATSLAPDNPVAWGGLGNAYAVANYQEKGGEAYARAVSLSPENPTLQMGHAHILKTLGDQEGSLRAYRAAIAAKPDFGEVYWSMANLKIFRFEDAEVEAMEHQLEHGELSDETEVHFRFALGKAYEDRKDYEKAWSYYHSGNQRQRPLVTYDPVENSVHQEKIRAHFTRDFLESAEGHGYPDESPIFIVGLGRSGSTLIEQILASHSQVEGTEELSVLANLSDSISRYRPDDLRFPAILDSMRPIDWRALGLEYLEGAQRYRMTDKPIFTDKLPNNFPYIGLIHLILPNAKIINARRHPIDTCLGNYKQLFGRGQNFTYDVFELADYYKEYCLTMDHWNEVLPGKVLDVHYEETVTDLEGQVARILDHCGLPFEEQCLRFHETKRAVKTASSEQVRQPIYTGGMGTWRRYESYLDDWKEELAPIIESLPDVVKNAGL